jgi:imidazolonepropionase-like amidohydrolase
MRYTYLRRSFLLWAALAYFSIAWGQVTFPYNGVYDQREGWYVFTNATIITEPGRELANATLLIRNGRVVSVGTNVTVPAGAVSIDLTGYYIYPSLIDPYSDYGMPEAKPVGRSPEEGRQALSNKEGAYAWNEALKPEFHADEHFSPEQGAAGSLREMGFGAVVTHQQDGISRGSSAAVALGDQRAHELILSEQTANHLSFRKGVSTQAYPTSLMGAIALLRQTYLDGQWYTTQSEEVNLSLEAWNALQDLPQVFEVSDWQEALRAARIGDEFGVEYIIKGAGDEYQRLDEMRGAATGFILPLTFPEAFDVSDPYDAMLVSLAQMRHWERAPSNPGQVAAAGIPFALTANGIDKPADFFAAIRKAIEHGLSEDDALRALTVSPAEMMGIADEVGTLAPGKRANFLVTSDRLFAEGNTIHHNWVLGRPHVIKELPADGLAGKYQLRVGDETMDMEVEEASAKIIVNDSTDIKVTFTHRNGLVNLSYQPEGGEGMVRLSGVVQDKRWTGRGQDTDGNWLNWSATMTEAMAAEEPEQPADSSPEPPGYVSNVTYPFNGYGWTERPTAETVVIRNATVWTNEEAGILENADVLIQDGKIAGVGVDLRVPRGAREIDGTGKHVTPGIIDEHSHIALARGTNESSQACTAEVRIGDVIDATEIDIYRQLAGGVTTIQVLHGSANPIGGQSGIIKLRWGYLPEEMKIAGADGFIKFALGENVKQSNWNSGGVRFPQTRMGVEQVYENYFTRAREYGEALAAGENVRRDLELEALLEILNEERFITCHSYQQGEINMLMHVAERFGFRVNTFTHILEGYKVADKMAEHGAGGSSFSDWWAYKYEVIEAIPHNGALMHEQGVTVAFNSDDAEMARRLNQEAAKAVLFGGVPEEEAFKFVTLNPAKLLHIDDQTGSLAIGKDADVVIWDDHPLSVYAQAEKTFVDGICFYDMETDAELRASLAAERNQLIQKMLDAKANGQSTRRPHGRRTEHYHCDTTLDEG